MEAGRLRHRITIEAATQTRDAHGGMIETWAAVATVWARVRPLGGQEALLASQAQSLQTHEVRMRYRPGVSSAQRITMGTRVLSILSVRNIEERGAELVIACQERG